MKDSQNHFSEAIIILDNRNQIVGVNPVGEQLLRTTEADLSGKSVDVLFPRQATEAYRDEALREGRKEVSLRLNDGQSLHAELTVSSISNSHGISPWRVLIIRDLASSQEITIHKQQNGTLKKQNAILQALQETTFDLHSSLELENVLQNIVKRACDLLETKNGYLGIVRETNELEPVVGFGTLEEALKFKFAKGEGVAGTVWESGKPLVIDDYDRWRGRINGFKKETIRAIVGMPLILDNQVIGIVGVAKDPEDNETFSDDDVAILKRFADLAVVALQNAHLFEKAQEEIKFRRYTEIQLRNTNQLLQLRIEQIELMQEQMQELAIRDPLTELYNRRYLKDTLKLELASPERSCKTLAILMMDSDHLKGINDKYGHKAGDDFLVRIAGVLRGNIRAGDIACRYGGDEFVVVMSDVQPDAACERAENLRKSIANQHIVHRNEDVTISVSIGIAMFPEHGSTGDELLHNADQALYEAKRMGKNCVVLYRDK